MESPTADHRQKHRRQSGPKTLVDDQRKLMPMGSDASGHSKRTSAMPHAHPRTPEMKTRRPKPYSPVRHEPAVHSIRQGPKLGVLQFERKNVAAAASSSQKGPRKQ